MNKVIRLPDGRFITRKLVVSDPAALAQAKPEEVWTINDGKSHSGKTQYTRDILIKDMDTDHLRNAMRTLLMRAGTEMATLKLRGFSQHQYSMQTNPKYVTMHAELEARLKPKTNNEPQPARVFDFT